MHSGNCPSASSLDEKEIKKNEAGKVLGQALLYV
jgi:hypothetical protein